MNSNTEIQSTSFGIGVIACMLWLFSGVMVGAYSTNFITIHEAETTAVMGQSYGTPYTETTSYSFNTGKKTENASAWYKYWIEYYTATDVVSIIGSAERTSSTAKWYADSTVIIAITAMYFAILMLMTGLVDALRTRSNVLGIVSYVLFILLLLVPTAFNVCKLEFLYWVSH